MDVEYLSRWEIIVSGESSRVEAWGFQDFEVRRLGISVVGCR